MCVYYTSNTSNKKNRQTEYNTFLTLLSNFRYFNFQKRYLAETGLIKYKKSGN